MLEDHIAGKGARDELDIVTVRVARQERERAVVEGEHRHRREIDETCGTQERAIATHADDESELIDGNR